MIGKRELRIELVSSKLNDLKNSVIYIKEFLPSDYKLLDNRKDRNALYKEVENSIQLMIDICAVIDSDIGASTPSDEDNIIDLLEKDEVISHQIAKKIHLMKGFRNLIAHRYGDVNQQIAYDNIKSGINDFNIFISEIEKFLDKHKNKGKQKGLNKKKIKVDDRKMIEKGKNGHNR